MSERDPMLCRLKISSLSIQTSISVLEVGCINVKSTHKYNIVFSKSICSKSPYLGTCRFFKFFWTYNKINYTFLGAFTKTWKRIIRIVMSVCSPFNFCVGMKELSATGQVFIKFVLSILLRFAMKFRNH